jgi:ankyrin repeat protein
MEDPRIEVWNAIRNHDLKELTKLLNNSNYKKTINTPSLETGNTALHYAIIKDSPVKVVELLLQNKAKINQQNKEGMTPLHYAAINDSSVEVVELLLQNKANVNQKNNEGMTPLHYAAKEGHEKILEKLLEPKYKADINENDIYKATPLYYAANRSHINVVKLLINHRANVNNQTNNDSFKYTLLHVAVVQNNFDMIKLLIGKGANPNKKDYLDRTPLNLARKMKESYLHERWRSMQSIIEALEEAQIPSPQPAKNNKDVGRFFKSPI